MGFADFYFKNYQVEKSLITDNPASNLGMIITIPCFNEEYLLKALKGLYLCLPPKQAVEVIILINFPEGREAIYEKQHIGLYKTIQNWNASHFHDNLRFYVIYKKLPLKTAGVGHARRVIMDEALRRFNKINKPDGIIVGFDADCTCDNNYLKEIENLFLNNPQTNGCSIYFEHPVSGNEYQQQIYDAIIQYELYLRYYVEALRLAKFPFAYHTLGSSFAVRADIYAKQGGMNKRKAGEDFYFLHKIIPLGNYCELNSTRVIPSPRESNRVPFGTGAAIINIIQSKSPVYLTYNPQAFECLNEFFKISAGFFKQPVSEIKKLSGNLHPVLKDFLEKNNFEKKIFEINSNCTNLETFKKRFYAWFNGLMALQFLNHSHESVFEKIPVSEAAALILKRKGIDTPVTKPLELLEIYRKMQLEKKGNELNAEY